MRILVINNVYPSEKDPTSYVFVENQTIALKKHNIIPIVLDIDLRSYKHKRKLGIFREIYNGVVVYRYSIPLGYVHNKFIVKLLNKIIGKIAYKKIIKKEGKINLIQAHFGILSGYAALQIYKSYRIPYIITEHHSKVLNMDNKDLKKYMDIYNNAKRVIVVGIGLKNKLDKIVNKETIIVPNVIDVNKFTIINISKEKKKFTFLSIGHLIPSKNHELLLKAYSSIEKQNPNVELIIVGEGYLKKELIELSKKLQIKNVKFIDRINNNELPLVYNKANCFVLPSKFETFGVVYAEALSCGIPVISTKCGGPELFVNKSNGYLIDNDNYEQLVISMKNMIKNYSNFSKKDIRESIINICSEDMFYRNMKKIINEAIKNEN